MIRKINLPLGGWLVLLWEWFHVRNSVSVTAIDSLTISNSGIQITHIREKAYWGIRMDSIPAAISVLYFDLLNKWDGLWKKLIDMLKMDSYIHNYQETSL